jgi:hypothetical protein
VINTLDSKVTATEFNILFLIGGSLYKYKVYIPIKWVMLFHTRPSQVLFDFKEFWCLSSKNRRESSLSEFKKFINTLSKMVLSYQNTIVFKQN